MTNRKYPGVRLHRVGLRRGTRYQFEANDTFSPPCVLEEDVEVLIRDLGEVFNVYETLRGQTIFVRVCNEVRDEPQPDTEDEL
jgi:hypothetical protein